MSSKPAVDVRGLSKEYLLKHNAARPTNLVEAVSRWPRSQRATAERFVALQGATFEVAQGEVIGVIGHNGAGKSTLMKILSRVIPPTSGEAFVRGRLGSLLEVGTGFHPDLTGRENIFLNGSMLGMSRAVVRERFDEIVGFSGAEQFLDTPVKRYSSGMYVRLAFSVAAHLECDVLIVDEVLAVGDEAFQRKCLGKMSEVVGRGRTVLFVSHNMSAISALAQRTIVFERGHLVFDGATNGAIERYLQEGSSEDGSYSAAHRGAQPTITRVELSTSDGGRIQTHGSPLRTKVEVTTDVPMVGARLLVTVVNRLGRPCAQTWLFDADQPICRTAGAHRFECTFPNLRLAPGQYVLSLVLADRPSGRQDAVERACPFEVVMDGEIREGGWPVNDVAYFEDSSWRATPLSDS